MVTGVRIIDTIRKQVANLDFDKQEDRDKASAVILQNTDYQLLFEKQYPDASDGFREIFARKFLSEVISLFTLRGSDTQPSPPPDIPEPLSEIDKETISRLKIQTELWLSREIIDTLSQELAPALHMNKTHHGPAASEEAIDQVEDADPSNADEADPTNADVDGTDVDGTDPSATQPSTKPKRMTPEQAQAEYDSKLRCLKEINLGTNANSKARSSSSAKRPSVTLIPLRVKEAQVTIKSFLENTAPAETHMTPDNAAAIDAIQMTHIGEWIMTHYGSSSSSCSCPSSSSSSSSSSCSCPSSSSSSSSSSSPSSSSSSSPVTDLVYAILFLKPTTGDQSQQPPSDNANLLLPCLKLAYHTLSCASHINNPEIRKESFQELLQKCMKRLIPYIKEHYATSERRLCTTLRGKNAHDPNNMEPADDGISPHA